MCDREHFNTLRTRVDALEDSVIQYHAKTDERLKTLFASCERLGTASGRLMWSLVAILGIVLIVSVFALVYGAVGHDGFNAVTRATQEAARAAR